MPAYTKAEITVHYEAFPYEMGSRGADPVTIELDRFIWASDTLRSESEVFGPLSGGAFKLTKDGGGGLHGKPAAYNASITKPIEQFTLYWDMLPIGLMSSNGALFKRLYHGDSGLNDRSFAVPFIGRVNSEPFEVTVIDRVFPAGTLLLDAPEWERIRSPLLQNGIASRRIRLGLNLKYSPWTWLDVYAFDPAVPANSGLYRLSTDGVWHDAPDMVDGMGLYNVRPFDDLFMTNLT